MSDTTPPTLTELNFPSTVDLSHGGQTVTFSVSATDDLSGPQYAIIFLTKPITELLNGNPSQPVTVDNIQVPYPGSLSDGQNTQILTLSPFNTSGTYTIDHVALYDNVGNIHTYTPADLQALGTPTSFTVTGSTSDTTPPTLTGLSFPSTVDLSHGGQTVTFTVVGDGRSFRASVRDHCPNKANH
jgi:hypothetical protein